LEKIKRILQKKMFSQLFIIIISSTYFVDANPTEGDLHCGEGEAIDEGYATYGSYDFRCCKSGKTVNFTYSINGGGEFSDMASWIGTKDGNGDVVYSSSYCIVDKDSETCAGDACTSLYGSDDCYFSETLSVPHELCLYVRCDAPFLSKCVADSYTFSTSPIFASWYTDPLECTRFCGTGQRTMNRECRNVETQEVLDDAWCEESGAPEIVEECNTQDCRYFWKFGESTGCKTASGDCGEYGVNVTETFCYELYEDGEVDRAFCDESASNNYVKIQDSCFVSCSNSSENHTTFKHHFNSTVNLTGSNDTFNFQGSAASRSSSFLFLGAFLFLFYF
jgi:hypothetical protein